MITALTPIEEERQAPPPQPAGGGGGKPPYVIKGFGGGGNGGEGGRDGDRLKLGVWIGVAGIVMFFSAIISAMVVRRSGDDWRSLELPDALWVSTALLLLSSAAYELGRRYMAAGDLAKLRTWMGLTLALGLGFLGAQVVGWKALMAEGVVIGASTSGSFFYLLTAAHGAHVAGGLLALSYVTFRAWSMRPWPTRAGVVDAAGVYWHFMDALWLGLLALLLVWG